MIECEYRKKIKGKEFSVFYSGGYLWQAWLEGTGNIVCDYSAEDTIKQTEKKLGIKLNNLKYINYQYNKQKIKDGTIFKVEVCLGTIICRIGRNYNIWILVSQLAFKHREKTSVLAIQKGYFIIFNKTMILLR